MSKVCKTTKNNGEPCQSPAIGDTGYCYFHNPEMASKRAESRKKGGLNRRAGKKSEHGPYSIRGSDDVMRALEDALNDVDALENSHSRARTIGYLCQIILKTLEIGAIEERLEALEKVVLEKGKHS